MVRAVSVMWGREGEALGRKRLYWYDDQIRCGATIKGRYRKRKGRGQKVFLSEEDKNTHLLDADYGIMHLPVRAADFIVVLL